MHPHSVSILFILAIVFYVYKTSQLSTFSKIVIIIYAFIVITHFLTLFVDLTPTCLILFIKDPNTAETTISAAVNNVPVGKRSAFIAKLNLNLSEVATTIQATGSIAIGAKIASSVAGGPVTKTVTFTAVAGIGRTLSSLNNRKGKITRGQDSNVVNNVVDVVPQIPTRPDSPSNPFNGGSGFLSSPTDETWSFFWHHVPDFIRQSLAVRIPAVSGPINGQYNLLFLQYNLMVYLMALSVVFIALGYFIIIILKTIRSKREFLQTHIPRTLGRVAASNWLNIAIKINQFGILLHY